MKRIRRGPDEVSLSRLSMSAGPVKYDHEIFVSAHAGDLQGVLRYFEPSTGSTNITPAPSSTSSVNAGGNDPDASISSNLQSSVNVSHGSQATSADVDTSGVRSPRPGTTVPIISNGRSTPQLSSSSKKRHPSSDKTNFDASNSEYIDRLLHCAAKFDWPEFIGRQLVLAPGFRTSKVKSAFRRACAHGSLGVVKLMLDGDTQLGVPKFCNLADAGTDGKTGLHIACHHGRPRVIEELLARAAQNNKGRFLQH